MRPRRCLTRSEGRCLILARRRPGCLTLASLASVWMRQDTQISYGCQAQTPGLLAFTQPAKRTIQTIYLQKSRVHFRWQNSHRSSKEGPGTGSTEAREGSGNSGVIFKSLCLERVEQVGCGRLGGQLPGVDLAGVQADQVQVGVGEVGAGEQERQPVPAAGGAGGCPGDDEQGPGLSGAGRSLRGFRVRRRLRVIRVLRRSRRGAASGRGRWQLAQDQQAPAGGGDHQVGGHRVPGRSHVLFAGGGDEVAGAAVEQVGGDAGGRHPGDSRRGR
jgi:hypothetical protein